MVSCQQHAPAASTPGKDPVPILQQAEWASGPVWIGGKSRPHRNSIPDRPTRRQSLYRLSYPANYSIGSEGEISVVVKLASHLHIVPRSRMNGAKPPFTHTVLRWCLIKNNNIFPLILSPYMSSFPLLSLHRSILSYFPPFSFYSTTFLFLILHLLCFLLLFNSLVNISTHTAVRQLLRRLKSSTDLKHRSVLFRTAAFDIHVMQRLQWRTSGADLIPAGQAEADVLIGETLCKQ